MHVLAHSELTVNLVSNAFKTFLVMFKPALYALLFTRRLIMVPFSYVRWSIRYLSKLFYPLSTNKIDAIRQHDFRDPAKSIEQLLLLCAP